MQVVISPGDINSYRVIPRLHDLANVQQACSKCIQNTHANCWTFAWNLLDVCCYML